jgi:hypothetical protein
MNREIDIFGVFLPDLLVWIVVAFFLGVLVRRVLSEIGFYRLVWHRPLFDTAVYVLLLGGVVSLARGLQP